jgi:5-methylcytosine-specific restriction enzyme subunit McrC
MSKLFELYVFQKLKKIFPDRDAVTYHDKFRSSKETDILIRAEKYKCVVDCKYKPQYKENAPSLEDKRQLAGYTRMINVYNKLSIPFDDIVKGVLTYSHQDFSTTINQDDIFNIPMGEYVDFYKVGIQLPVISQPSQS